MKNRKKLFTWLIIILVVLLAVVIIGKKAGWLGKSDVTKVSTDFVTKKTIVETVSANGKIEPEVEVKISPDVSGEIKELDVKEGDHVKKGDLLAKINPDFYISDQQRMVAAVNNSQAQVANAKASLSTFQSQLTNAEASYNRSKTLFASGTISPSDWDAAQAAYNVAVSNVEGAKQSVKAAEFNVISAMASLKESSDNLVKTSVYAPVNGTISLLSVEKGERVVGTSQFSGTEMMRIADLNEMEVKVSVNENDIVRVKIGDTASVEVDAYQKRKFKGLVTEISNSSNNVTSATTSSTIDQVTNFDVKVRILRESYTDLLSKTDTSYSPFRPGMSATVDIQTETVVNALAVPIQAVTSREDTTAVKTKAIKKKEQDETPPPPGPDNDKITTKKDMQKEGETVEYVFIYSDGIVKRLKVKTGIQDNTYIQILDGLKEKQEVVVAPYKAVSKTLKDGDKVKKVDKKDLFAGDQK